MAVIVFGVKTLLTLAAADVEAVAITLELAANMTDVFRAVVAVAVILACA